MEPFKTALYSVYDIFFDNMYNDPLFKEYFKDKNYLEVKEKQIKGILQFYTLFKKSKFNILKSNLIKLGQLHEKLGIDYPLFLESVNRLEILIVKELFKHKPEDIETLFFLNTDFFEFLKNYPALGYLKEYVRREKELIREFIETTLQKESMEIKEEVDRHIQWEEKILDFIADNTEGLDAEIDHTKCEIGNWLGNFQSNQLNSIQIKKLQKFHLELHNAARSLITFKKEEKYDLLISEYNYFVKNNLLFLSLLLTFLFSKEIHELKKDPLTKLLTRKVLTEVYPKVMELSILTGLPFGLAFADIDNFKTVNDRYGHQAGDKVLFTIAQIMKKNLRKSDYVFRYGGEEFIILINGTNMKDFYSVLEKIRKEVESLHIKSGQKSISITISIGGVLVKTKKFIPLSELIKIADQLMYKAKKEGKNRIMVKEVKV